MSLFTTLALAGGLLTAPAAASDNVEFDLEGYYRVRGYAFRNLYDGQEDPGRFMAQRVRLQPSVNFEDRAKFTMMIDGLDDTVWGDNQSYAVTSVFSGEPSTTDLEGHSTDQFGRSNDMLKLKRAWMEFKLPIGLMKVGRQESNWGMGLLSNNGNGFDDSFGENHAGSTFDRLIFATRPLAVAQGIMGKPDSGLPLFFAVGFDRLVEDPLIQYYGYECASEIGGNAVIQGDSDAYDSRCDSTGEGYHDLDHGYTEERSDETRGDDWWVDQKDDVWEMVYVLIYKGEGLSLAGSAADFTLGTYVVMRQQEETGSGVIIADMYTKFLWKGIYLEGEVVNISGQTDGIALQGSINYDEGASPLHKEADIWGYVARAGYKQQSFDAIFETGYASGDDNVADDNFTGRPLHPDYNAGLIIYEEVLSRVTAARWSSGARALWSNGGVYNSRYVFPTVTARFLKTWSATGGFLMAWPDKADGAIILCDDSDYADDPDRSCGSPYTEETLADEIGWEVDFALKTRFQEHMLFSLETGYARVSNRLPLKDVGLNGDGKFFTLQSRIAYEF